MWPLCGRNTHVGFINKSYWDLFEVSAIQSAVIAGSTEC